ncbi:GGDEF domain-containing protein [Trichocoleus sp. ST-U3]|uniref:GGDEF domain-containing protein n=1 Tax=Coleofasciculus sp. FACHB-542 TaxID=2692787 RepID=UPI0016842D61|nr:GGDEF domain-containing protein [Coleofasciculus sp. FACHB-542]MBD2086589.1 GGDEF domain-containing protein [Coleofasciculus sp. FACHB-542]
MNQLLIDDLLFNQIFRDPLTGLFNRRYMFAFLRWQGCREGTQQLLGLILLDIDGFAMYNDWVGFSVGDILLQELGRFLQRNIPNSAIACRKGGDEFAVILPETSIEDCMQLAEQLREGAKLLHVPDSDRRCTVSAGVAVCFPEPELNWQELIKATDIETDKAKSNGRDRVEGPIQFSMRTESFLEETYSECKQVIIKDASGFLQDLQATEIDSWEEYTLLHLNLLNYPVTLLQKTCPITEKIDILAVSSKFQPARETVKSIAALNCIDPDTQRQAYWQLQRFSGWTWCHFDIQNIVSERPIKISFDSQNRLHAEGEPAIQFADGYNFYSYHGVTLPEEYGKLHPSQWQPQWLLKEDNSELRRVLIQGIGYSRICQELQATKLDSWQEYTLLKIDNKLDVEPIYLLKMTCPSTGHIHALRVPPNMKSAREAIGWANWGIDPEEFSVQT